MDRILPAAAVLALVEGLVVGYVFSGVFSGMGLDPEYWLLVGAIVAIATFAAALLVDRMARARLSPGTAAGAALVLGALAGLVGGYLVQPVGGPT